MEKVDFNKKGYWFTGCGEPSNRSSFFDSRDERDNEAEKCQTKVVLMNGTYREYLGISITNDMLALTSVG